MSLIRWWEKSSFKSPLCTGSAKSLSNRQVRLGMVVPLPPVREQSGVERGVLGAMKPPWWHKTLSQKAKQQRFSYSAWRRLGVFVLSCEQGPMCAWPVSNSFCSLEQRVLLSPPARHWDDPLQARASCLVRGDLYMDINSAVFVNIISRDCLVSSLLFRLMLCCSGTVLWRNKFVNEFFPF